jgi:hypothetical protein
MPKILYFIDGSQPSNYDRQVVASLSGVQFRNLNNVKADDPAEECDGVAGVHVPAQYSDKASAEAAMTEFRTNQHIETQQFNASVTLTPVPAPAANEGQSDVATEDEVEEK